MDKLKGGAAELGLTLTPLQLEQFEIYYRELIEWNRKINLTSVTGYDEVRVRHFLDSLTVSLAMATPPGGEGLKVIDVGTGAGLPGLPLKIVFPGIRLVLLEATIKKTKFLEHLVTRLGLENAAVLAGRAEDVAHDARYRENFDLVLSRAVAALPVLAELTLPLAVVGGRCVAQKKGDIGEEVGNSARAIETLGGRLREIRRIEVDGLQDDRCLVVIDKVAPTPGLYPRRAGVPAKRPIR